MTMIKSGILYKQRDIVLIPFPYSDLSDLKKRPALIISNAKMRHHEDIICCLVTSNPTKEGILLENQFFEGALLPYVSWVKPYRIFTLKKNFIIKKLSSLKQAEYNKIFKEICSYII